MDASSFLSLPIITGVNERCGKESVQEVCNAQLRGLVKWGSSPRKVLCWYLIFKSV